MPKNLTAFRGQILIWVDVSKRAVGSTIGAWSDILPGDLVVQPLPLFRPNWLNFSFLLQKYENFYNCKYKVPREGQGWGEHRAIHPSPLRSSNYICTVTVGWRPRLQSAAPAGLPGAGSSWPVTAVRHPMKPSRKLSFCQFDIFLYICTLYRHAIIKIID